MSRSEQALSQFVKGYNCAQSVVFSFCDDLSLGREGALKLASGFGAGMARNGQVCGAVTGGIIVLGTKYGRGEYDDKSATETTYLKVRALMDRFAARQGAVLCNALLHGCDLTTEEGQARFKENDLLNRTCKPCVQSAVEILEGIMGLDARG